jgi:hypothetical protein
MRNLTVYGNIWGSGNILLQKGSYNITLTPTSTLTANRTTYFPRFIRHSCSFFNCSNYFIFNRSNRTDNTFGNIFRWNSNKFYWICRFDCLFKRNNLCFHFSRNCRPTLIIRGIWRSNLGNPCCTTYGGTGSKLVDHCCYGLPCLYGLWIRNNLGYLSNLGSARNTV